MKITRKKIIIAELVLFILFLAAGVTYSIYTSRAELTNTEVEIAQFVFNANKTDAIELPVSSLIPGQVVSHNFSVTNNLDSDVSDVSVEYQILISTLHVIPLRYEITHITDTEEVIVTCDQNNPRNEDGFLVCESPVMGIAYGDLKTENFRIDIIFPAIYNDSSYANLIDYVDLEINSWQKIV